jgi:uncharacterized protein (UPF0147 family)
MGGQKKETFKEITKMSSGNKTKSQTYNTGGLYGNSTTNKNGTFYNPSSFETQLVNQTTSAIPSYLQQLVSPTYDSQSYKNRQQQLANAATQSLENNIVSPLSERGLTRGSSINQMSNQLANKLTDAELDLMNSEDSRVANVLSQLMNYYQVPYNMMSSANQASNNLYQNALANSNNNNLWSGIANAAGTIAGGYLGGPGGEALTNWALK